MLTLGVLGGLGCAGRLIGSITPPPQTSFCWGGAPDPPPPPLPSPMYRVGNPQSAPTASYAGGNGGQCGVPPAMPYPSHGQAPAHYSYGPTTTLAPPLPQPPPGPPPSSNCMPRYAHPSWQQQQQQQQPPYSPSASYAQQQAGALPSDDQFGEHQQQLHGNQMMRLATWPGTQYSMGGRPSPTGRGGAYAMEGMALSAVGRANR